MRPLSPVKRRIYLWICAVLFLVSVPAALLYAGGYRYKPGFGLVRTGGIFLSVPYKDAVISLNGQEVGRTSILNKSIYIDDLAPSAYVLQVVRGGSRPWYRTVVVEPQIVTEARVTLVPEDIEVIRLQRGGRASNAGSIPPSVYDAYRDAFKTPATSTEAGRHGTGVVAFIRNGDVFVRWTNSEKKSPDYFCGRPSYCTDEISIEHGKQAALSVGFFSGGVVYATSEGGVLYKEIDIRPTPVSVSLYPYHDVDMRVVDGTLIVKNGSTLYAIEKF